MKKLFIFIAVCLFLAFNGLINAQTIIDDNFSQANYDEPGYRNSNGVLKVGDILNVSSTSFTTGTYNNLGMFDFRNQGSMNRTQDYSVFQVEGGNYFHLYRAHSNTDPFNYSLNDNWAEWGRILLRNPVTDKPGWLYGIHNQWSEYGAFFGLEGDINDIPVYSETEGPVGWQSSEAGKKDALIMWASDMGDIFSPDAASLKFVHQTGGFTSPVYRERMRILPNGAIAIGTSGLAFDPADPANSSNAVLDIAVNNDNWQFGQPIALFRNMNEPNIIQAELSANIVLYNYYGAALWGMREDGQGVNIGSAGTENGGEGNLYFTVGHGETKMSIKSNGNVEIGDGPHMIIDNSSGYVGIGTTNPDRPLHVVSDVWGSPIYAQRINAIHGGSVVRVRSDHETSRSILVEYDDGSTINENFVVWANGDVNLLNGDLKINKLSGSNVRMLTVDQNGVVSSDAVPSGGDNLGDHNATQNIALNNNWISNDGSSFGLRVLLNGDVRASSKLGINMDPTYDLDVNGDARIFNLGIGGANPSSWSLYNSGQTKLNGKVGINTNPSGSGNDYLIIDGDAVANNWKTPSDKRLKKDIIEISNPLEKVMLLNGYKYKFIDSENFNFDDRNHLGFIAQELIEIFPELVSFNEDKDVYLVNYIGLIPVLSEAIKEQQKQIDILIKKLIICQPIIEQCNTGQLKEQKINITEKELFDKPVLFQNYPNPFSQETIIQYYLPEGTEYAEITIYDIQGKLIEIINIPNSQEFGSVNIVNENLSDNQYVYSFVVDGKITDTKMMISLKY